VSCWETIFIQSKANWGVYNGDNLPLQNWKWPEETWFQKRLRQHRETQLLSYTKQTDYRSVDNAATTPKKPRDSKQCR
jgi:hypothetical protein